MDEPTTDERLAEINHVFTPWSVDELRGLLDYQMREAELIGDVAAAAYYKRLVADMDALAAPVPVKAAGR